MNQKREYVVMPAVSMATHFIIGQFLGSLI